MKKKDYSDDPPKQCEYCGSQEAAPGEKLVRCAACSQVRYCGRQCQQAHWPSHKAACLQSRKLALAPKKGSSDGKASNESPPRQAAPEKARPTDRLVEQPDEGATMKKASAAPPPRQCAQCGSEAAPRASSWCSAQPVIRSATAIGCA